MSIKKLGMKTRKENMKPHNVFVGERNRRLRKSTTPLSKKMVEYALKESVHL